MNTYDLILSELFECGFTHHEIKSIEEGAYNVSMEEVHTALFRQEGIIIDIGEDRKERITKKLSAFDQKKHRSFLEKYRIEIISRQDIRYPKRLKEIGHSPALLYMRGVLREHEYLLGVVGSRKNTPYAKRILEKIIGDLVVHDITIVSGGATGVDTLSHELTLEH